MNLDVSLLPQGKDLLNRMGPLFQDCLRRYAMGDASSVRVETAERVFASLCFVLRQAADQLDGDLYRACQVGQERLTAKADAGRALWRQVMEALPAARSDAMQTTLHSIGQFLQHCEVTQPELDCAIDYPLLIAVPDRLAGIDYLNEWLRRLLLENRLMQYFDPAELCALLKRYCADYEDLPVNLCSPVLLASVGGWLLCGRPVLPDLMQRRQLAAYFAQKNDIHKALRDGAKAVCAAAGIDDTEYLVQAALNESPRIQAAAPENLTEGVFC